MDLHGVVAVSWRVPDLGMEDGGTGRLWLSVNRRRTDVRERNEVDIRWVKLSEISPPHNPE